MAARKGPKTPEELRNASSAILAAVEKDKRSWLTLSQVGRLDDVGREACRQLVKEGRLVAVGKVGGSDAFALNRHSSSKEQLVALAETELLRRGQGDRLILKPIARSSKAYKGLPGKVREHIPLAIARLFERGAAFKVKVGNSNLFVLASNLEGLLAQNTGARPAPKSEPKLEAFPGAQFDRERIVEAYVRLARDRRSPHVIVSDLQREAGVPLEPLKEWLLSECRAHRAIPLLGEPARATEEQLAAALLVEGQRHLYVRLLQEGQS